MEENISSCDLGNRHLLLTPPHPLVIAKFIVEHCSVCIYIFQARIVAFC